MQQLKVYNSLTRTPEVFTANTPGHINIYVCGVTVYDFCHIGHARTYVCFDVIIRYLRWLGYTVCHVRNITDIEDKIIARAREAGETTEQLVARFIDIMHEDFAKLNILPPDHEPRATETIAQMIAMIETLMAQDYAYQASNGDIYYRVSRFQDYGKLSGQHTQQLRAGQRVEVNTAKNDPLDFVLWKAAKANEPSWDSPWGPGRPGWHLECSCMSKSFFGDNFDIHGGGSDLRFPHHENEIAQSEAANGCAYANYWLHSGMVQVNKEKMSKSLGNFFVIRDVLAKYPAEVIRYFLISGHYRSEINYSEQNLDNAKQSLQRLYLCLRGLKLTTATSYNDHDRYTNRFTEAMNDDFNTPEAMAVLFDLARHINKCKERGEHQQAASAASLLRHLGAVLGILQQDPEEFLTGIDAELAEQVEALIAERTAAREQRNWQQADKIRDQLTQLGVAIEDGPDGTAWRKM